MGEDIFSFVLQDISGIPTLPVFIGNYLLDLLSAFFPIFILLAMFIMVYTGLTRGGDWKTTAQTLAPTFISLAVIMGLLSMKSPYSEKGTSGGMFQDTNSYTVVEMMNTFLGFGNIFADALTHKVIYGNIDVTNGNTSFDGYFPSVLQALIDKDKERVGEIKNFLVKTADRGEILSKIRSNNTNVSMELNRLINNLHYLGIIEDFRKVTLVDILNIRNRTFITNYDNKIQLAYYDRPLQENNLDKTFSIQKDESISIIRPESKYTEMVANDFLIKSSITEDDTGLLTLKIDKGLGIYKGATSDMYEVNFDKTLAYLQRNNFEQEVTIIDITKEMITSYLLVYKEYAKQIDNINGQLGSAKNKEEKIVLEKTIAQFKQQQNMLMSQIEKGGGLLKDLLLTLKVLADLDITSVDVYALYNRALDKNFSATLDKTIGIDKFWDSIPERQFLSDDNLKMIKDNYLSIRPNVGGNLYSTMDENDYRMAKNASMLAGQLNARMKMKAFITIIFYDRLQEFVKDDALFQTAMDFNASAPFNKIFLSANEYQAMAKIENEKNILKREFQEDRTVASKLKEEIEKQYSTNDLGQGNIIHWTDLGKYYGTFKNLYSPMISNIYLMSKTNEVDNVKVAQMTQFLQNLESKEKANKLVNVAEAFGVGQFGFGVIKSVVSKSPSSFFSGIWDAIQTIGGVYLAILFINVILPAFIWMFVIISYYIEMSIYVAVFPIGFMFMIFQSYRQSMHQYINMLLGFILMPIVLVSMYFIVLYIDMLLPMFFKQFMPFFGSYSELSNAFSVAMGQTSESISTLGKSFNWVAQKMPESSNIVGMIGNVIYTLLSMLMSTLLLMTFFRAHEYMSKILNVNVVGIDAMNSQSTLQKFTSLDKTGLSKTLS